MAQSLSKVYLHLIFSTKHRVPFLNTPELQKHMWSYLAGTLRNLDCPPIEVGGAPDHTHALCLFSRTMKLADLLRDLKRSSSKWAKTLDESLQDFQWQLGYGAFSVSKSDVERVRRYIRDQEQHHKKMTFQEEFRRLLQLYGVEYDERYVWD